METSEKKFKSAMQDVSAAARNGFALVHCQIKIEIRKVATGRYTVIEVGTPNKIIENAKKSDTARAIAKYY